MGPCDVLTMWIKGGVRKIRLFCRLGFLRFSLCFIKWFLHLLHFFQILFFPFLFKIFLRLSTKKIVSIKKSVLMMQWILKDQIKVVWCAKYIPILIVYYILFLLLFFFYYVSRASSEKDIFDIITKQISMSRVRIYVSQCILISKPLCNGP